MKRRQQLAGDVECQPLVVRADGTEAAGPSLTATAKFSVQGMVCSACSGAVEKALLRVPGVLEADVALLANTAVVKFDEQRCSTTELQEAIDDAGFDVELLEHESLVANVKPAEARLLITGMTCSACSTSVENALLAVKGITSVAISLTTGEATVTYMPDKVTPTQLLSIIDDCGFDAELLSDVALQSATIRVDGLVSNSCCDAVEQAITALDGVASVDVNPLLGAAKVEYNPSKVGLRRIVTAIQDSGFEAYVQHQRSQQRSALSADVQQWWLLFTTSLGFTVPVFVMAMVVPYTSLRNIVKCSIFGFPFDELFKWVMTTPVQFWLGRRFQVGALKALRNRAANMDVLVALGTNAAYAYSVISILHHHFYGHHYSTLYKPTDFFETSAMLITFILMGKFLEAAAKGRTSDAITKLMQLAPDTAVLVTVDSEGAFVEEHTIPLALVEKGDVLKVLPGARMPTDGEVLTGSSIVDESMITGEAKPVKKKLGDGVIGGTLNVGQLLHIRATRVGSDTALAQIVRLVQTAQLSKAPIQAFADRVSAVFVPIVVLFAFITWLAWFVAGVTHQFPASWVPEGHSYFLFALLFGIAVMVIACPCALGLATPTAVMVGTGVAATHGILIKSSEALQAAQQVRSVIFDKTGTLTEGRPKVVDYKVFHPKLRADDVWLLAASLESVSEHPLARTIIEFASQRCNAAAAVSDSETNNDNNKQLQLLTERNGVFDDSMHDSCTTSPKHHSPASSPRHRGGNAGANDVHWLLTPRDAEIVVAQGVRGWLPVPSCVTFDDLTAQAVSEPPSSLAGLLQQAIATSGALHSNGAASKQHDSEQRDVKVMVGNKELMKNEGVTVPTAATSYMQSLEDRGCTCIMVALHCCCVAVIAVQDPLKPEARGTVSALHVMGLEVYLVTGDNWRTARAIAEQLGIQNVMAEVPPSGKANKVRDLQALGRVVAMVGDGINDSPALAAADVGIAIGSGTDIAIEAADYVLMRSDLEDVITAIDLSRTVIARVKWNYVWAMGYNALMIPIAAGALYPSFQLRLPPMFAGLAMVCSSVSVVCSSLLLRKYKKPHSVLRDVVAVEQ